MSIDRVLRSAIVILCTALVAVVIWTPRKVVPDFRVMTLDGRPLQLSALKGKVVIVDFWATWCPPCVAEVPNLNELYSQYKDKGFEIIAISLDEGGEDPLRSFVTTHAVTYPVVLGDYRTVHLFGLEGRVVLPTTYLIDKKGRIARRYIGYQDKGVFEKEIQQLLAE